MLDNELSVGQSLVRLARAYTAALSAHLRPLSLTPAQHLVIMELQQQGEETQRQLAISLAVEQATMANTLARMNRDGLIVRRPHPDDGRAQLTSLTAAARELVGPAGRAQNLADQQVLAALPIAEQALFASMLARVSAAMDIADDT